MADSWWKSTLYSSEQFVEACGAVVFDTSTEPKQVLLLYDAESDEWVLPKGRRNCRESRIAAAIREVREESGCAIRPLPVTMATRAPSELEPADVEDTPRTYDSLTEAFMLDVRDLDRGEANSAHRSRVKLVWWFVAEFGGVVGEGEPQFRAEFARCDAAVGRLTFQKDREVLAKAIDLVDRTAAARGRRAANGMEAAAAAAAAAVPRNYDGMGFRDGASGYGVAQSGGFSSLGNNGMGGEVVSAS
ncbi:hypothetical protein GGS23DRAFT_206780 [Durotheca rogersii]|uniref:uncharacterized protein n=1 Tax=Durotheca rogersii TaxID=419775 RepID=UPI00221E8A88|nr:uncharacterized protein GGS23DRAFT_206780 [Durotheca rogersii]KAI5861050.1 hypothetical protein GGS23DRAFT_206780 [Durotheca rogersii]